MKSALKFFKDKINDKDFGGALTNIVYQYCTNPECKPAALDEIEVCGYCRVVRSTHGLPPGEYGSDFRDRIDEPSILVVYNPSSRRYTYLVLPPVRSQELYSYMFESPDYCYYNSKDGFLEDTTIIGNGSGNELLVEAYAFDEGEISGEDIFPDNFISFSKYCLKYLHSSKKPTLSALVKKYNAEN